MKDVYGGLSWAFGIIFLLAGIGELFSSPLAGLSAICVSALLLPPVRNIAYQKTNIELPVKTRAIAIFILLVANAVFVGQSVSLDRKQIEATAQQAEEQAKKQVAERQKNIDFFNQNLIQILAEIRGATASGDFKKALSLSSKYLSSGNQEIIELNAKAAAAVAEADRQEKTQQILAQLKTIPPEAVSKIRSLYEQLVKLNPNASEYATKLSLYSDKVKEKDKKDRAEIARVNNEVSARLAKFGAQPTRSSYDGTYRPVESYLKQAANDPDSVKLEICGKDVTYSKAGWVVHCDYRGRNAFNAMIRQSARFTILHDKVIYMEVDD